MEHIHRPPPRPHRPSPPPPLSPDLEEKRGGWTERRREGHREREGAGEPPPPLQPALKEKEGGGCRGGEGGRMPVERSMCERERDGAECGPGDKGGDWGRHSLVSA